VVSNRENDMKICVYGTGAIGGYLALAGNDVCAIARGAHLEAIQRNGLRLRIGGEEKTARIPASEEPGDFGPQDTVICALKAHQSWSESERFAPLLGVLRAASPAVDGSKRARAW
jgi:2-dehydropantoate 2-reductase